MMNRRCTLAVLIAALLLAAPGCRKSERQPVKVVTTPEVAGTGVARMLAKSFSDETKVPTDVTITDEQFVPSIVEKRKADIVITTSRSLEPQLERTGRIELTNTFAYNDFLIVGPKRDPARVRTAATAADALRLITRSDARFCSPVDVPRLRQREAELWSASKANSKDDRRYRTCRGDGVAVLQRSARDGAYTITDRDSFEKAGKIALVPLLQRTAMLHNDYTLYLVTPARRNRNAAWFAEWTMSFRGRELIENYRFQDDRRLFVAEAP